ncbi:3-oxo-5-alpha-steroid 4-dehydrogenase-domain-containing protein [Phascolomyces articulosus]|uniref:3-oxo-5-alpha-steroid 4-dehydrogenase-domain-containing protein n=1 Tax=Phascolomyces articulosus TaxID=60185 RepID=A0AAD5PDP8_9FUNG|nr:3-oxo-5-alpha-steroid 4-dehydrogenase-domain-containing protein [Phascolomyces articulosus]
MYLILFLCFCLCTLTLLSILAKWIQFLRTSVLPYGKLNNTAEKPQSRSGQWLAQWTVPKSWFSHFYIVGLALAMGNAFEIGLFFQYHIRGPIMTLLYTLDTPQGSDTMAAQDCLVALMLFIIHLARRVYESLCIERPSPQARMHISHYLTGLGFYGAMVFATWVEGAANLGVWDMNKMIELKTSMTTNNNNDYYTLNHLDSERMAPTIRATLAIPLFLYAANHQHTCHHILGSLRENGSGYQIPRGDWFESIVVPHYLADILIYLAFNLLCGFQNKVFLCGLVWTLINLSITASETEQWYQKTFGDEYKKTYPKKRWIILPWVY